MLFLISFFLFILGACVGSFLSVVIIRSVAGVDWKNDRSRCDHCNYQLSWRDNIPLLSFVWLKGKCRYCSQQISILHPFLEFLTGVLFVWWYWFGFAFFQLIQHPFVILQPLFWLLVGIIFLVIIFYDLWYMIIPDWTVVLLLVLVLIYRSTLLYSGVAQTQDFLMSVFIASILTICFYGLWWFTQGNGFGFGDVKLILALSLIAGWREALVAVFIAFFSGAVIGVVLLLSGKVSRRQPVPFGPFLIVATAISLIWGQSIYAWYLGLM